MIIKNYNLKENNDGEIMITFDKSTSNIKDINVILFNMSKDDKTLKVSYYIGECFCFSYFFNNLPLQFAVKIKNKSIILINEEDFHYHAINEVFF